MEQVAHRRLRQPLQFLGQQELHLDHSEQMVQQEQLVRQVLPAQLVQPGRVQVLEQQALAEPLALEEPLEELELVLDQGLHQQEEERMW
jgi:hypothetical protein